MIYVYKYRYQFLLLLNLYTAALHRTTKAKTESYLLGSRR